jgi:hypothetical protein
VQRLPQIGVLPHAFAVLGVSGCGDSAATAGTTLRASPRDRRHEPRAPSWPHYILNRLLIRVGPAKVGVEGDISFQLQRIPA